MAGFFGLKKVWILAPWMQVALIAILYVASIALGHQEYARTGTVMGYPPSITLFLAPNL